MRTSFPLGGVGLKQFYLFQRGDQTERIHFLRKVIVLGLAGVKMNHIFSTLEILMNKFCHFKIAHKVLMEKSIKGDQMGV